MKDPFLVLAAMAALAIFYVLLPIFLDGMRRYRKPLAVDCPVGSAKITIYVDARLAAWTSLSGHSKLQVKSCPFWPEMGNCKQACLSQLQAT